MANTLSFGIKLKMAEFGKQITDTVKKIAPLQLPTTISNAAKSVGGAVKSGYADLSKEFQKQFNTMFEGALKRWPKYTKEVYSRATEISNGVKDMFSRFGAELDSSESMSDALSAFKNLGDGVTKVLFKTLAPWGKWILLVGGIVAKFSKYAAEMEQTQMKFNRAFSRGGRSQGAGTARFERAAQEVSSDGLYTQQSAMEALGNIRASNPYLSSDELEQSLKLGKELASLTGGDLVGSTEKVASVLHAESVDMQSLIDLGVVLNKTELAHLQSLDTAATRLQRNQMIMQKIAEANKGGAEEFGSTLNGQWQKFTSMLDSIKLSIGKIVAPIMRVAMDIVNPIMEAVKELFGYTEFGLGGILEIAGNYISTIVKPLGAYLVGIAKTLANIGKILLGPIIYPLKFLSSLYKSGGEGVAKSIKKYYDFINKILVAIQRLQKAIYEGPYKMLITGYQKFVKPFVDKLINAFTFVADYILGLFEKILEPIKYVFKKIDDLTGTNLSDVFADYEDEAQKKKEQEYLDPRAKLSVNFEDASSMWNRIQKSILERQSPQVKMIDLLTAINTKLDTVTENQHQNGEIGKEQKNEIKDTNTTLKKQNMGLQYG